MTAPATDRTAEALSRIAEARAGLQALAELVVDRPDIAGDVISNLAHNWSPRVLVYVSERTAGGRSIPEYIAGLAKAAKHNGADVAPHHSDKYAGLNARFGPVTLHIYTQLDKVGAVATRNRRVQITDWQPDPLLAAFGTAPAAA
jgi:hypothetical protein